MGTSNERLEQVMKMKPKEMALKLIEATDRATRNMSALKEAEQRINGLLAKVAAAQTLADKDRVNHPTYALDGQPNPPGWKSQLGRDLHVALQCNGAGVAQIEANAIASLRFPTMIRKMWGAGEIQRWLDEMAAEKARIAMAENSAAHTCEDCEGEGYTAGVECPICEGVGRTTLHRDTEE